MPKIDKTDLENISLIKKEFKLKNITTIKIKKGNYEIELSTETKAITKSAINSQNIEEKVTDKKTTKERIIKSENIVKSPMVGVAYLSADPASPPYIKIGQHVKQGDTLLLIEAMKTFNEVKAPISGIVKEIIVLNSQPVEFGDDLIIFE
tara:strand:- start:15 stop:464 length:450 start_codon:yes stop_codon:yes gene_type:complete